MRPSRIVLATGLLAISTQTGVAAGTAAAAVPDPLSIVVLQPVLVSTTEQGLPGDADSSEPSTSDDGSKISFFSRAQNFVNAPPPLGGVYQKRGITLPTGRIRLASRMADYSRAGGPFRALDLGRSGSPVLFVAAGGLVPADTNGRPDVYLSGFRDRVQLISRTAAGAGGNGGADDGQLTGSNVAFASTSSDLVAGDRNGRSDIFVAQLSGAMQTVRLSVTPSGGESTGQATRPTGSRDGRFVSFLSTGIDLVPGLDRDAGRADAFVRDLQTGTTVWASAAAPAGTEVLDAAISPDGRMLLQRWGGTAASSVQLTDLVTGVTRPVPGADRFSRHALSEDNRLLVFLSPIGEAMVSDLATGATRALSAKATGGAGNGTDGAPVITPSGRYAVFASLSTNLVPVDTLGFAQIYRVPVRVA